MRAQVGLKISIQGYGGIRRFIVGSGRGEGLDCRLHRGHVEIRRLRQAMSFAIREFD